MGKSKINEIIDKLIDEDFYSENEKLSQEELFFLKNNPRLLSKITDVNLIKKKYVIALFLMSISLSIISKIVQYSGIFSDYFILNDLFTGFLFSVSMEMMGATIIVYFLEILLESRVRKNQKLVQELLYLNKESEIKE